MAFVERVLQSEMDIHVGHERIRIEVAVLAVRLWLGENISVGSTLLDKLTVQQ